MKALLIASANDAAHAISEQVAGTSGSFVDLMNEKAKSLGMNDTEFSSVHGLPPSKGQKEDITSCYDMALLGPEVLKYPKIIEWASTKTGEFRNGAFILNNHNKLLSKMPEVDGLKTGYLQEHRLQRRCDGEKGRRAVYHGGYGGRHGQMRDDLAMEKLKKYFGEVSPVSVAKRRAGG